MRVVCLAVAAAVMCVLPARVLAASNSGVPKELVAADEAYKSNVAIGDSLGGKPPTMEQVSDVQSFYEAALAQAQAVAAASPGLAEAHRLLGMILCTGYHAVQVQVEQPGDTGGGRPRTVFALTRGGSDCEQGIAEIGRAIGLARSQLGYQVDYAEALLACGDAAAAREQAGAAWKLALSAPDRVRCARMLVQIARTGNQTQEEIRWLRELVKCDPEDKAAGARLAKLAPPPPAGPKPKANAIIWLDYETGMKQSEQKKKPVLIDFTATWCGWCKKLDAEVFPNRELIALSQKFVCIRVDGDERGDLTDKYGVDSYPTAVILDDDGQELGRMVGFAPADEYIAGVKAALSAKEAR